MGHLLCISNELNKVNDSSELNERQMVLKIVFASQFGRIELLFLLRGCWSGVRVLKSNF